MIEKKFGDFPLSLLSDRRTRGEFMAWRDKLASTSRRQADYTWTVLARILSWALNRGLVVSNPCEKGGRLYRASRADKIWTADDEALFINKAPHHLQLALTLALWTGQRQGDLLRLPWSAYDGSRIRLRQGKTGARVVIPVGAPLKGALDATPKRSTLILVSTDNKPWTEDGFRSSWRKACAAAGISGLTFHDLRGTAVTLAAEAGRVRLIAAAAYEQDELAAPKPVASAISRMPSRPSTACIRSFETSVCTKPESVKPRTRLQATCHSMPAARSSACPNIETNAIRRARDGS